MPAGTEVFQHVDDVAEKHKANSDEALIRDAVASGIKVAAALRRHDVKISEKIYRKRFKQGELADPLKQRILLTTHSVYCLWARIFQAVCPENQCGIGDVCKCFDQNVCPVVLPPRHRWLPVEALAHLPELHGAAHRLQ